MDRKEIGLNYFRILWLRVAEQIILKAIKIYNLDEKQEEALKKAYLKPNHYYALMF
jgi:hypothetical protein